MALEYSFFEVAGISGSVANCRLLMMLKGLYSELPAPAAYVSAASPGNKGVLAYATDRQIIYRSTGSAWEPVMVCMDGAPTTGDILYFNGTKWTRIAGGTSGYVLTAQGAGVAPAYALATGGVTIQTDVTGSRTIGSVYHNTTGKMMLVTVTCNLASATMTAFSDANASPSQVIGAVAANASPGGCLTFVVLSGNYYKVTGGTLVHWIESY